MYLEYIILVTIYIYTGHFPSCKVYCFKLTYKYTLDKTMNFILYNIVLYLMMMYKVLVVPIYRYIHKMHHDSNHTWIIG